MINRSHFRIFRAVAPAVSVLSVGSQTSAAPIPATTPAEVFPLTSVRLLDGPFTDAVKANRSYMLALDPDRLLAPFLREAGLPSRKEAYGNWEGTGLGGHTGGHYLAALADMIASGNDPDGELKGRLDHMLTELQRCQQANGDGYIGGVPGSREFWKDVGAGKIQANGFGINGKWVPWYNVHKTFAGLRDAALVAGDAKAREIYIRFGDWCEKLVSKLSDQQMQDMLQAEHGGMNEVMADLYAMTGDAKYLRAAQRFCHKAVLDPLERHEDKLTGLHANTQIPKVIGLERIATLTGDKQADSGARYFWENVTGRRTVAFGGNSVSEHFNDPANFKGMLEHREGPETCNTYNMLRLTEQLFATEPKAAYADYYERALYNHILSTINPEHPGFVYFTPIRPDHYRVYSQPETSFWCCVGTGMENPGKYGEFIYARAKDGVYVNLFIPSELKIAEGMRLRQETSFPDEASSRLVMKMAKPSTFTLRVRHPGWVAEGAFAMKVNGETVSVSSKPSSYAEIRREWKDGDRVEVALPMRTTVERLPDGSPWVALLRGPIVLAAPGGTQDVTGLRASDGRMGHVAAGPLVPLDKTPVLVAESGDLPGHVVADDAAGPLHFRLKDVAEPAAPEGLPLVPFFRIHDERYQIYWQVASRQGLEERRAKLASSEKERAALEAATIDSVAIGEQQPEVEHDYKGDQTETGVFEGRRWRHGKNWFQYTLKLRGAKAADLFVTYSGGDSGRAFDIHANGTLLAKEELKGGQPGKFVTTRYPIPEGLVSAAPDGAITIKFTATKWLAGGIFDLRLMKPGTPVPPP